ncbi:MAG: NnrU family protein [Roseicyclus sp.]|nr:NnrU family protein [Roseicyclus sp.]MBO6626540.1 NnrU family protein [Roseicyclus sp.]MBO6923277.1 NnrU family protein [Roseicyclus sp.]
MAWAEFALAFTVFFASHALPVRPPLRPWLEARLGQRGFAFAYSALSLVVLAWVIGAAARAPLKPLWGWAPWHAHVVLAVMLAACLILALAIARPNPFSFGGARNDRFDPARAGIVRLTRHPLLTALALWAGVHILPNGDLAHVILFGTFAGFAVIGERMVDRRKRRTMGQEAWHDLRQRLRARPLIGSFPVVDTGLRLILGVGLYGALIWFHPIVFGVSPLP